MLMGKVVVSGLMAFSLFMLQLPGCLTQTAAQSEGNWIVPGSSPQPAEQAVVPDPVPAAPPVAVPAPAPAAVQPPVTGTAGPGWPLLGVPPRTNSTSSSSLTMGRTSRPMPCGRFSMPLSPNSPDVPRGFQSTSRIRSSRRSSNVLM